MPLAPAGVVAVAGERGPAGERTLRIGPRPGAGRQRLRIYREVSATDGCGHSLKSGAQRVPRIFS